jgi:hypothetical protein
MTKPATLWKPDESGTATDDAAGFSLLLETGDKLLLETGDELLLEDTVISEKQAVVWSEN